MQFSILAEQTKVFLREWAVPKMGRLTQQQISEMFELTIELQPSVVAYRGDCPGPSIMSHGLALQKLGRGRFYYAGGEEDVVKRFSLEPYVVVCDVSGIDILHLDSPPTERTLSDCNTHAMIWTKHSLNGCKFVRSSGDYRLYCNRPYN